jgi:cation diffusion facilitator CzcD-associated flavoprotein CzcO
MSEVEPSGAEGKISPERSGDHFDVVVIGAGQAGLAIGCFLGRQGRRFVILDRASSIGAAWRERWESLTLFTPRRYSALPGLPFPGDPDGYPTRDEVITYLERYASTFDLPLELNSKVTSLELGDDGRFRLEVDERTMTVDQVVVATGPFQAPSVPPLAEKLGDDVFRTHAVGYRRPDQVPQGTVLVVGGGNTGFQIAKELSATHKVVLSVGSRQTPEAARGRRGRSHGSLRRRQRSRGRRRDLGDRLPRRLFVDQPADLRPAGAPAPLPGRHRCPWALFPWPHLAAHARLGADRLGARGCRIHLRAGR